MAAVGEVLCGRYEIVREIGREGAFVLWLAEDRTLCMMQAIKELQRGADAEVHRAWVDEIVAEENIRRRLDHPNIAKVFDCIDDGESVYIVMDYLQGKTLHEVIAAGLRSITEEDVIDWGRQLCGALQYLHDNGLVYCGLQPNEVLLLDSGILKLFNFASVKKIDPDEQCDTLPFGARGYAAPEVFMGNGLTTPKSDIYSLGATLFYLATGRAPSEFGQLLPSARAVNPGVSASLDSIIAKATQVRPEDRFASCDEMRYFLETLPEPLIVYASPPRSLFARIARAVKVREGSVVAR